GTGLPGAGDASVRAALTAFVAYRQSVFSEPAHDDAWDGGGLCYSFAVGALGANASDDTLEATDFRGGELDWYSFSVGDRPVDAAGVTPQTGRVDFVLLPVHVTFSGMPRQRWWEFEDCQIDFGELQSEHVDLSKMVVAEF